VVSCGARAGATSVMVAGHLGMAMIPGLAHLPTGYPKSSLPHPTRRGPSTTRVVEGPRAAGWCQPSSPSVRIVTVALFLTVVLFTAQTM
jgi:hypothetical protein